MISACGLALIALAIYATALGLGKVAWPGTWKNREEALWIGRFAFLFGALVTLDGLGISPHQISEWLQDILTAGGGAGVG